MANLYDRWVLPVLLDACCGMKIVQDQRARIVPRARGRVLEVGIGSGLNLPYYDRAELTSLEGLDPADQLNAKAERRAKEAGLDVRLVTLSAEQIPAEDGTYDSVVCTFTLCTIPDAVKALHEMKRVLKPGGELLFCEHGRSPDPAVSRWQDRLTPWWRPLAGGCHLNRDVRTMLSDGGFRPTEIQSEYLKGPKPMLYVTRGVAVAA